MKFEKLTEQTNLGMGAEAYFNWSVQQLQNLYTQEEAENLMYWVFEDILLLKRAHLRLFSKDLGLAEELKLNSIVNRLLTGEPLQYILGYAYFLDFVLKVNKNVLIPRPETEELVNWVSEVLRLESTEDCKGILDICTGSGCIGLALKRRFPLQNVTLWDISKEALGIAQENAKNLNVSVQIIEADILGEEATGQLKKQAALTWVCNPPYISEIEKTNMHPNVLNHEPHLALFVSKEDPLLFYHTLITYFQQVESAHKLFFEISEFQQPGLQKLVEEKKLSYQFKNDLQGKPRMLYLQK